MPLVTPQRLARRRSCGRALVLPAALFCAWELFAPRVNVAPLGVAQVPAPATALENVDAEGVKDKRDKAEEAKNKEVKAEEFKDEQVKDDEVDAFDPWKADYDMKPLLSSTVAAHTWLVSSLVMCVCFLVARTEPSPSLPLAIIGLEKRLDYVNVLSMSAFLSGLSGMVNAVCILEMGMTVAHQTGNASHTGRLAGIDASRFAASMLGFFAGALVAGYNKCDGEALYAGRYSPNMLGASIAVVAGALLQWNSNVPLVSVPLLAFSQGMQNAVTRKFSSLPICTTHMTGYLTDFGSLSGAWVRANLFGGAGGPSLKRIAFFMLSLLAYVGGGYAAKVCRDEMGILAALIPAALMAVTSLGFFPLTDQKDSK